MSFRTNERLKLARESVDGGVLIIATMCKKKEAFLEATRQL